MISISTILLVISSVLVVKLIISSFGFHHSNKKKYKNLPPGPKGLPIVGNMLSLMSEPGRYIAELSRKYGSMATVYLGSKPMVVMNDFDEIKELMKTKQVHNRPPTGIYQDFSKGLGIAMTQGELWQANRRLILTHFHDSGKHKIEDAVQEELKNVTKYLETVSEQSSPIEITRLMLMSACNVTFYLCFSKLYDYGDKSLVICAEAMNRSFQWIFKCEILSRFRPWIKPLAFYFDNEVVKAFDNIRELAKRLIQDIRQENDVHAENDHNFITRYLHLINEEAKTEGCNKLFFDEQLQEVVADLFAAGTETLTTFMRWAVLFLLDNKEVVEKMQHELDEVVGRGNLPMLDHQARLPYTMASIYEMERMSSVAHMALIHSTSEDIKFKEYIIPKNTDITYNIYGIHYSPDLWTDPHKFMPQRFLDENGRHFRPEHLIPFGTGRRLCPGESLAKIEMFKYLSTLVHLFDFDEIPGEPTLASPSVAGLTRSPQPYKVLVKRRKD